VLWFHGTPGARRQVAPGIRLAAEREHLRIIGVERPGIGASTPHHYAQVKDFAADIEVLLDHLGLDRVAVVGLSGGGPYTLACAHELPDRVLGACVLGGVAPGVGEEAVTGGPVAFGIGKTDILRKVERPVNALLRGLIVGLTPLARPAFVVVTRLFPEGDRRVFETDGVREMFLEDLIIGVHDGGVRAALQDAYLFTKPWGFKVRDIHIPVHWWHGDADSIIPLRHGLHMAALLQDCTFTIRPGDSHLSGYAAANEVVEAAAAFFSDEPLRVEERGA
jgi:pimeloyl-ACP methyl ester carboxylesterase